MSRDFKIDLWDLDNGSVGLDQLTIEIRLCCDMAFVNSASFSNCVGLLQLVGSESAMRAVECHDDNLTEVGHTGQQEAGRSLDVINDLGGGVNDLQGSQSILCLQA